MTAASTRSYRSPLSASRWRDTRSSIAGYVVVLGERRCSRGDLLVAVAVQDTVCSARRMVSAQGRAGRVNHGAVHRAGHGYCGRGLVDVDRGDRDGGGASVGAVDGPGHRLAGPVASQGDRVRAGWKARQRDSCTVTILQARTFRPY